MRETHGAFFFIEQENARVPGSITLLFVQDNQIAYHDCHHLVTTGNCRIVFLHADVKVVVFLISKIKSVNLSELFIYIYVFVL